MEPLLYQIWGIGRNLLDGEKDFIVLIEKVENNALSKEALLTELHKIKAKYYPVKDK